MIKIALSPKQAELLKVSLKNELEHLQKRVGEIKDVLTKLDKHKSVDALNIDLLTVEADGKFINTKSQAEKPEKEIKRRGRKTDNPDWITIVPEILKEQGKALSKEQIAQIYIKQSEPEAALTDKMLSALSQSLQRLRTKYNAIISTGGKGKRGSLYALPGMTIEVPQKEVIVKEPKTRGRKKAEVTEAAEGKKPRGKRSQYNWNQFVEDTLLKNKRVLSLNDFLSHAMVRFSIPPTDKKATYGRISPILTQMVKAKKIKTYAKPGISRKFYGLIDWFSDDKDLITIYK